MEDEQTRFDVLALVDRLDDLVKSAAAVPLTDQVRIGRGDLVEIVDQMRAAIPGEIAEARGIVRQRDALLAAARCESERVLADARATAARERSETAIAAIARSDGDAVVEEARREARELERAIDEWAGSILSELEANLERFRDAAQRGRERLHERSSRESAATVDPADS